MSDTNLIQDHSLSILILEYFNFVFYNTHLYSFARFTMIGSLVTMEVCGALRIMFR